MLRVHHGNKRTYHGVHKAQIISVGKDYSRISTIIPCIASMAPISFSIWSG